MTIDTNIQEFNKWLELEVLPLTKDFPSKARENIRNKLRYALNDAERIKALKSLKPLPDLEQLKQKYKNENDKAKSFLLEDRHKYESLGCGCHNGVFYYGTKLYRDGKPYIAIVTSDKKIYIRYDLQNDEIKNQFGLSYKDDFYEESLDHILSREAILKYVYENSDDITLKCVYEELIKLFKEYIYFEDERKYEVLACYRIAGYFMPVWRQRARLFIWADPGSAKSRLTMILHNLGFNSIALGDWTLPYIKTLIQTTRGETHIDDFETLSEEQETASIRLVKIGYMRGFKAGKMSDGNKRKPEVNDLFNTTTLNNTKGLDFITNDRCITIRIPKIEKQEYDREPNFEEIKWKELRDKQYIMGLKYSQTVKDTYETIKSDKIRGRAFAIIKPELTIAKLISDEVYNDLIDFWMDENEQRQTIDYETDWEFLILKKIYQINTEEYFVLDDEVIKPVGSELYKGDDLKFNERKRGMGTIAGNVLSRSPIFKKRTVNGKTQYKVKRKELISFLEAKKYLKVIKDMLGEPEPIEEEEVK